MEYDTICMSGGGLYGFAFIGALEYLNNTNYININSIKNFVGTSIGSVLSLLLVCGYSPLELGDFIIDFDFTKINPDISIENVFINYGISNGERLEYVLKSFIKNKLNIDNITFKQLFELTNKNLIIIGTNFTKSCEEVFSHNKTPDMSVITAVRISISIPIFFTPVLYNNDYYVDGCITNNFPLKYCNIDTTIGLYIGINGDNNVKTIINIIMGCLNIVTNTINVKDISSSENIIKIEYDIKQKDKGFFNFDITTDFKLEVINLGQIFAKKFVENKPTIICKNILNEIINKILH
jgi:predicted acylesterase/phospholipase RssA